MVKPDMALRMNSLDYCVRRGLDKEVRGYTHIEILPESPASTHMSRRNVPWCSFGAYNKELASQQLKTI